MSFNLKPVQKLLSIMGVASFLFLVPTPTSAAGQFIVPIAPVVVTPTSSNPIDTTRRIDWTQSGATITNRSSVCTSETSAVSAATLNTDITNCSNGGGGVVSLAAGTYSFTTGITLKNNVTLRGAGADQTFLTFSGTCSNGTQNTRLCFLGGANIDAGSPQAVAHISGLSQGASTINLGTFTTGTSPGSNPAVGDVIILNQLVDSNTRAGDTWPLVFVCLQIASSGTGCTQNSAGPQDFGACTFASNNCWGQFQAVKVTSISGTCSDGSPCSVGITPSIHMPNWKNDTVKDRAWWSTSHTVHDAGIENLSVANGTSGCIGLWYATNDWIKGVRCVGSGAAHYLFLSHSVLNTIRDSYLVGDFTSADAYGLDCTACSSNLFENNIIDGIRTPFEHQMGEANVFGYNYVLQDAANGGAEQQSTSNHGIGMAYTLTEGNDGNGLKWENYYGQCNFCTAFRNRYWGKNPQSTFGATGGITAINIFALTRFTNVIGNVLGTTYFTNYQKVNGTGSTNDNTTVYCIGNGDDCKGGGTSNFPEDDAHAVDSLFRWGNWDRKTNAVRWCGNSSDTGWSTTCASTSEVPTSLTNYSNAVPSTETLPNSFYLSGQPVWWTVNGITPAWPPIGPDVTGKVLPAPENKGGADESGGHADRIPARICFEDIMGGSYNGGSSLTFNGHTCYGN